MALKDIKYFLTSINKQGILKSNKYIVEIEFPPEHYLRSRTAETNILEEGELFRVRCDSVQLPGFTFATIEGAPRLGYGPLVRQPYAVQQYDEMNMTFVVDGNSRIHRMFYHWANSIVNFQGFGARNLRDARGTPGTNHSAYEVGYFDKYRVNMTISVYQTGAANFADTKTAMKIHVYDAIPMSFPPIQLNWEDHQPIRLNIPFVYTDFSIEYIKE